MQHSTATPANGTEPHVNEARGDEAKGAEAKANEELPERYLKIAHRHWRQDQEVAKLYDQVYRAIFPRESIKGRSFINFGPGKFRHKYWRNADRLYDGETWAEQRGRGYKMSIDIDWNLLARSPVAVPTDSIEACYSSHVVEHAWDEDVSVFFREVHRILKPGGVFRVTCPDAALGVRAMEITDRFFYPRQGNRPISYKLLEWSSLVTHKDNDFRLSESESDDYIAQFATPYAALTDASQRSCSKLQERIGAHVNWFTPDKLMTMLLQAGFDQVLPSGYAQSILPIFRDVRYFDSTDPHMSCYVDAVKRDA